jgi:hypothetical protein
LGSWYFRIEDTIMSFRLLFPTVALIAALSPAVSQAAPETEALNTCSRAFAASIATDAASPPSFKLKYSGGPAATWSMYFTHEYTFFLQARDPKTGAARASATCSASVAGTLIALKASSTDAAVAALAAKF